MSEWIKCSDQMPDQPNDSDEQLIVAVKRASNGKTYVFAASFLNKKELYSEEEDADEEGRIYATGWYELRDDPEYETAWYKILEVGDEVTHWMPLPSPPEDSQ